MVFIGVGLAAFGEVVVTQATGAVKVPPDSSGGVIAPARTRSASARVSPAIARSDFESASNTVGTTSASCAATATPTLTRE